MRLHLSLQVTRMTYILKHKYAKESLGVSFVVNSLLSDNNKQCLQKITSALLSIVIIPFLRIIGDKIWLLNFLWKTKCATIYYHDNILLLW